MLVAGGDGSVADPFVSFDGEWVYYAHVPRPQGRRPAQQPPAGADIYKIHVKTRKIVRLTDQEFTPNTGAADWSNDFRTPEPGKNYIDYGVFNLGPCPLPGGKVDLRQQPQRLPAAQAATAAHACSSSSWTTTAATSSASAI